MLWLRLVSNEVGEDGVVVEIELPDLDPDQRAELVSLVEEWTEGL